MRILYVVHQFMPEYVGGTEQDTWEVAKRMQARGHEIAIVHRAPGKRGRIQTEYDTVPVYRIESGPMNTWSLFFATFSHPYLSHQIKSVFRTFHPDLVHFQHLRGLPIRLVDWMEEQECPVFISLRDFWFVCPNAQLLDYETGGLCETPGEPTHCARCSLARLGLRSLLPVAPLFAPIMAMRNMLLCAAMRQANALFAFSRFVRHWYAKNGAPRDILHYVPRGIPRPKTRPKTRNCDDHVRFVYIGGLSWQKGIHVLIEAFNALDKRAELWIAGDESKHVEYIERLHKLAQHPGIEFLGRIDRNTVWQTIADADAVVVPSLWYETFSMLTREAFAMNVPVIASDHGALAEAVQHGVNGLLPPPGDIVAWRHTLRRFFDSASLRNQLRAGISSPLTMQEYLVNLEVHYDSV